MIIIDNIVGYVKGIYEGVKTELPEIDVDKINLILNFPISVVGQTSPTVPTWPGDVVVPPAVPSDTPPVDERKFGVGYAKAKPDKDIVNLWIKVGQNNVAVADGGPGLRLEHPPLGIERLQVPDAAKVAYINFAYMVDGGGACYEVMGYGADADIAMKPLDGAGYYIKASELE